MSVPNTFASATSSIPLANLDANFAYYDAAFAISGSAVTFAGSITLTTGTANGVPYLNASKVLTSGAVLTFDGTTLSSTKFAGALNGTVGATTATTGAFTTVSASTSVTTPSVMTSGATALLFRPNGVTRMTIGTDGDPITTAVPLQVTGTLSATSSSAQEIATFAHPSTSTTANNGGALIRIQNTSSTNGNMESLHFINASGSTTSAIFGYNADQTTNEGFLTFGTRNSAGTFGERIRLDSSGNLGIGTTSPTTKLHVNTGAAGYGITVAASSQTGITYQLGIDSSSNFAIYDTNAAAQRLVLSSAGNLGIGTSSPANYANFTTVTVQAPSGGTGAEIDLKNASGTTVGALYTNATDFVISSDFNNVIASSVLRFDVDGTERARIDSSGNLTISNGNLIVGTAGKGIDFSATSSGTGTMTSELLADYEEGTFTVTFTPSTSGTITLSGSYNTCSYTKVGRLVTVTGEILVSSVSTPVGSSVVIGGLPFAAGSGNSSSVGFAILDLGTLTLKPARVSATSSAADMFITASTIGINSNFMLGFSYIV